ncbi:MAG: tetratricopeptide repeat protein [Phycisphaerales bacterium]|nr:tetratricopeptide repeat protein [Phycisphaerales bacterium]
MAIFGRKKSEEGGAAEDQSGESTPNGAGGGGDPAKAARFFNHARTVHEASNYEYAATLWLQGLRMDPQSMSGLESFFQSAQAYATAEKRDKPSKEQAKNFGGREPVERYLEALLFWGVKPADASLALKALEAAAKADLQEPGYWIGERALPMAMRDKPKKETFLKMMEAFKKLQAFDLAVRSGEFALQVDPSDANLQAEVRNLAAQMTMSRGGYENTQEGGFRANIRDAKQQRLLEEESRLTKTEDAADRVVNAAKADYESRPSDRNAVARYARTLQERGRPEDEKAAYELLMKAWNEFKEFRFRQTAGDIRVRVARRRLSALREAAEKNPDDAAALEKFNSAKEAFIRLEMQELALRVENNPTDLTFKYELGVRHFQLGESEQAIALFQEAQNDPKSRGRALNYLGQSFLKMGWSDEAVDTLRRALDSLEVSNDELGLDVRYWLMQAMEAKARAHGEAAVAEEAYKVASGIAMQQINYRDIRARRDALQSLVRELKSA